MALFGKIAFGGKGRFEATGHPTRIHIQDLPGCCVVVLIALTVLAIDGLHCLFHVHHILSRAGIQSLLNHRLLSAVVRPNAACKATSLGRRVLISTSPCAPARMAINPSYTLSIGVCF